MFIFNSRAGRVWATLALAVMASRGARASQVYWTGYGEDSEWGDPANWAQPGYGYSPGPSDDVFDTTNDSISFESSDSFSIHSFTSNGSLYMSGGTLSASAPGVSTLEVDNGLFLYGATLRGFVINAATPVSIYNSTSNYFDNVTSNANINLIESNLRIENNLTLGANATTSIGSGSLTFDTDSTLSGGTVAFEYSSNQLSVEGNSTLTINGTLVHGGGLVIGTKIYVGGSNALINNGTISADVSGQSISFAINSLTNTGTLSAANGGILDLNQSFNNTGGTIAVGAASTVLVEGISITGGTINGPGSMTFTGTSNNDLISMTSNANFDLTNGGQVRIDSGLTLAAGKSINLDNTAYVYFYNTQNFPTGTINFGSDGTQHVTIEGGATLTVGAGATLQGASGVIGDESLAGGANTLDNNGLISANTAGGTVQIYHATLNNSGTIQAINGGNLNFSIPGGTNAGTISVDSASTATWFTGSAVDNTGGNFVINGTFTLSSGQISNGTISGTGKLTATDTSTNVLTNVTESAPIDLTNGGEIVLDNTTVSANGQLDNVAYLITEDNTTFQSGTITFGSNGTQHVTIEGGSTLTIGSGATIQGANGIIGGESIVGGPNTLDNNGLISANTAGGTVQIYHATLNNSGTIQAINGGNLNFSIPGGTNAGTISVDSASTATWFTNSAVDNTGGNFVINGTFTLSSGQISNGTISGTGSLTATSTSTNVLTNVAENAPINLTNGGEILLDNTTVSANGQLDNVAYLYTEDNTTFHSGTINFGSIGTQHVTIEGGSTLTIGAGATLRGANGTIGDEGLTAGPNTLDNNGLISANTAGGTVQIYHATLNNSGTIQAINGGNLNFSIPGGTNAGTISVDSASTATWFTNSAVDNTGGNFVINGTFTLSSGQISNGTISGSGKLTATGTSANVLTNVAENAPIDLSNGGEIVLDNTTVSANGQLDNAAYLFTEDNTTFHSGTISFGSDGTQHLTVEGGGTLTIDAGATLHGGNAYLAERGLIAGTNSIVNHGTISADSSGTLIRIEGTYFSNDGTAQADGGTLYLVSGSSTNTGTLAAIGSTLSLTTAVANTGGTISASNLGTILLNNASITGGVITTTTGGALSATSTLSNQIASATINANLNLSQGGQFILQDSSALFPAGTLDNGAIIAIEGNVILTGGTLTFGGDGTQYISGEGGSSLTIDSGMTIHGQNGYFGNQDIIQGGASLINQGDIAADVAGGTFTVINYSLVNQSTLEADNGGTLALNTSINNTGGIIHAGTGSTVQFNSITVTNGTLTGPGDLLFSNTSNNVLDNLTVNGNLDLSHGGSFQWLDGMTLTGTINMDNGANIYGSINSDLTVTGGTISFGADGTQIINIEGNTTLTISPTTTIHGSNGSIGNQAALRGSNTLINHGTINADGAGANFHIVASTFTNTGSVHVAVGALITIANGETQTAGSTLADGTITISSGGLALSGGTIGGAGTFNVAGGMSWTGGAVIGNGLLSVNGDMNISNSVIRSGNGLIYILGNLNLSSGAKLNLTQSDMIVDYRNTGITPVANIGTELVSAYDHGKWDGIGIASSSAGIGLALGTTLGYGDNSVLGYTTFDSQPVVSQTVFIKYTWFGDANLDGKVDGSDLARLTAGESGNLTGWVNGDFNYDGVVNSDDFALFMLGAAHQTGVLAPTVPEPAILGIILLPFLQRRRKHS